MESGFNLVFVPVRLKPEGGDLWHREARVVHFYFSDLTNSCTVVESLLNCFPSQFLHGFSNIVRVHMLFS
jgi:hypothetical protein